LNLPIISKPGAIAQLFIALGLFVSGMFGSLQQQANLSCFSPIFDRADSGRWATKLDESRPTPLW
jgi:hypothetical protein